MDGLLVIDKPAGLTSHDVVAWARRTLRERRVGHTGTLDPAATGVLPLVVGRATRLARFLSGASKTYHAVVRLGVATNTADASGTPLGPRYEGPLPARDAIESALAAFRGTFLQQPPMYSAKKVGGTRSYKLARALDLGPSPDLRPLPDLRPQPVHVTAHRIEIVSVDADRITLEVDCSAGFYVRALAHDLGERLGVGAHLDTLRRTRTGDYTLDAAATIEAIERDPDSAATRLIPLSGILTGLPAVTLTPDDVRRAGHGQNITVRNAERGVRNGVRNEEEGGLRNVGKPGAGRLVRLVDEAGNLVAIGEPSSTPGLLHPSVVLV